MKEYIEREATLNTLRNLGSRDYRRQNGTIADAMKMIMHPHYTPTADVVEVPESGIGDLSDGYHTFNELYHHRAVLFSVICDLMPDKAWKSKLHDTGDMYDGMFIVGIETPQGQATYHYDVDPYWDMFKVKELEKAPKWDGHTPQDAIERIGKITADLAEVVLCKECIYRGRPQCGFWFDDKEHKIQERWDYPEWFLQLRRKKGEGKVIVYTAGPISTDPNYKEKFSEAERVLTERGNTVINPAMLPTDLGDCTAYMRICFPMIDAADAVVMLDGWEKSYGSCREWGYAKAKDKIVTLFSLVKEE